jgi:hypothetical protein
MTSKGSGHSATVFLTCTPGETARLNAAGYVLVARWVRTADRSDATLKTAEAPAQLSRKGSKK